MAKQIRQYTSCSDAEEPDYRFEVDVHSKFRQKKPIEMEITLQCFADPRMFLRDFAAMPKDMQDAFSNGLSIPCEGSGIVGPWCTQCKFGDYRD